MEPTECQDEIEVTPEMIEAGVSAICAPESEYEIEAETAARIYRAMQRVRPTTSCEDPSRPSSQPSSGK
jgi:hypothetical protein